MLDVINDSSHANFFGIKYTIFEYHAKTNIIDLFEKKYLNVVKICERISCLDIYNNETYYY